MLLPFAAALRNAFWVASATGSDSCRGSPSSFSAPGRRRCLILPAPRHFLERLKEIDKFSLIERPEDAGFAGSNKASAIRDEAVHRVCDAFMFVPAGIDAVVPGKASHVP